jgi:hypothetical protein
MLSGLLYEIDLRLRPSGESGLLVEAAMQEHIPQWQASHLTQAEYCKTHGIKPHIFSPLKIQVPVVGPAFAKSGHPVKAVEGNCSTEKAVGLEPGMYFSFA